MGLDQVRNHFEEEAFEYDDLITKLIPKYHEQHEVLLKLIPFEKTKAIKVLDLGSGTGVLSYIVLKAYPSAKVTAFDLTGNMLEACRENLSGFADRLSLKQGNFGTDDFGTGYDLIISGLSTHHLPDAEKPDLYRRLFQALNPKGVFLNRELVSGASPYLTELYEGLWREYIKSNGEDEDKWFQKYREEDIPASVEDQVEWMKKAGFVDVGCHWRYFNFAIFGGRKSG